MCSGGNSTSKDLTLCIPALEIVERAGEYVLVEKRATHWILTLLGTWGGSSIGDALLLFFGGNLAILARTLRSHFETGVMGG